MTTTEDNIKPIKTESWMDKYARQTFGYRELDDFKPGDSLKLQYFPVPQEEIDRHQKEKEKESMQKYEEQLKQKEEAQKALLELREEETRENGHNNNNEQEVKVGIPIESLISICKNCDKHTILCECNKQQQQQQNPDHCDLKNSKRKSRKNARGIRENQNRT